MTSSTLWIVALVILCAIGVRVSAQTPTPGQFPDKSPTAPAGTSGNSGPQNKSDSTTASSNKSVATSPPTTQSSPTNATGTSKSATNKTGQSPVNSSATSPSLPPPRSSNPSQATVPSMVNTSTPASPLRTSPQANSLQSSNGSVASSSASIVAVTNNSANASGATTPQTPVVNKSIQAITPTTSSSFPLRTSQTPGVNSTATAPFSNQTSTTPISPAISNQSQANLCLTRKPCANNATCHNQTDGYVCVCLPGFTGANCTTDIDDCASNPCKNGGTCQDGINDFSCNCTAGYTGKNCSQDIDDCASNPCQHGGTCQDGINDFSCNCSAGYMGKNCSQDIDACASNPCLNGGTCQDRVNDFSCNCSAGFLGKNCSQNIDDCASNPCQNGGTCHDGANDFSCNCSAGYMGKNCSQGTDDCKQGVCNNGTCVDMVDDFRCLCPLLETGTHCSEAKTPCTLHPDLCPYGWECLNEGNTATCNCPSPRIQRQHACIEDQLFHYEGEKLQKGAVRAPFYFPGGIPHAGTIYHVAFVSEDGLISLGTPCDRSSPLGNWSYLPSICPGPLVAPLWTDLEATDSGYVTVRELSSLNSSHADDMSKVDREIISKSGKFSSKQVLLVTWLNISRYPARLFQSKENSTFQVALATDGSKTYAIFNYDVIALTSRKVSQWSGYTDAWGKLTGLASPTGDLSGTRHVISLQNTSKSNGAYECLTWLQDSAPAQTPGLTSDLPPCPCTLKQALLDLTFQPGASFSPFPFFSTVSPKVLELSCVVRRLAVEGFQQRCCYDSDGVLVEKVYPIATNKTQASNLDVGWGHCCSPNSTPRLCGDFLQTVPGTKCSHYHPPALALLSGTSMLVTVGGGRFPFSGWGEYVLLTAPGQLEVQGRWERAGNSNRSTITALALKVGQADALEIGVDGQLRVFAGGSEVTGSGDMGSWFLEANDTSGLIGFQSGVFVKVQLQDGTVAVEMGLPWTLQSATRGLLGCYNSRSDTFSFRNGTELAVGQDDRERLLFPLAQSWLLRSQNESIFNYSLGSKGNYSTHLHPDFAPPFLFDSARKRNLTSFYTGNVTTTLANTTCGVDVVCLVELALSRDVDRAKREGRRFQDFLLEKNLLGEKALDLSSLPQSWNLTSKPFEINLKPRLPSSAVVVLHTSARNSSYQFNAKGMSFAWTNMQQSADVRFIVKSNGTTGVYDPKIYICPCSQPDNCDYTEPNLKGWPFLAGGVYVVPCRVELAGPEGWCLTHCYPGADCVSNSNECHCPQGMKQNGTHCYDEDECESKPCQHHCENTPGSFYCTCNQGFQVSRFNCIDINECQSDPCPGERSLCHNTEGGHYCSCIPGYRGADCTTPVGVVYGGQLDLLEHGNVAWTQLLEVRGSLEFRKLASEVEKALSIEFEQTKPSNFIAVTVLRFERLVPSRTRRDTASQYTDFIRVHFDVAYNSSVPETALQEDLMDGFKACTSVICNYGSLQLLACPATANVSASLDLCASPESHDCHGGSTQCSNHGDGTFSCICLPGFRPWPLKHHVCEDIDECVEKPSVCVGGASTCHNLPGSYRCDCGQGLAWDSDQKNCIRRDYCVSAPCKNGASCVNAQDGAACRCTFGWSGSTCETPEADAETLKKIAIGVGAGVGGLCLVLVIVICCVSKRRGLCADAGGKGEFGTAWQSDNTYTSLHAMRRSHVRGGAPGAGRDGTEMTERTPSAYMVAQEEEEERRLRESFKRVTSLNRSTLDGAEATPGGAREMNGVVNEAFQSDEGEATQSASTYASVKRTSMPKAPSRPPSGPIYHEELSRL